MVQSFKHPIARMRRPAVIVIANRHAFAMRRMPGDGGADVAFVARDDAADDGEVDLLHGASGELCGERDVRFIILGDDQAAAGFLVEPMDDAGARDAADAAEFARAMVEQGVDERVFLIAGSGMHDQCRRVCSGRAALRPRK